jgi:glycerol-3-phosphate acyltransferase PlsY
MITALLAMLIAYLFGSISSAIVVCRLMHLPDPRSHGSKNPGATNVLRLGGKRAAIITLLGDALKGVVPVIIGRLLGLDELMLTLVAFFAFIGHLFPVFFGFEGGKGVATFIGALLVLCWPVGVAWIAVWMIMAAFFRYSSLSAITASALTPLFFWFFTQNGEATVTMGVLCLILIYRHKENITKLMSGTEGKIGK